MISLKETVVDPSDASSVNDAQILSQVLGSRSGYLRGLGRCVKPSSSSSSSYSRAKSNDDKTKELEQAALEITIEVQGKRVADPIRSSSGS